MKDFLGFCYQKFGKIQMEHFLQNTHTIFAIFVHYKKQKERYTIIVLRNIFFDMN